LYRKPASLGEAGGAIARRHGRRRPGEPLPRRGAPGRRARPGLGADAGVRRAGRGRGEPRGAQGVAVRGRVRDADRGRPRGGGGRPRAVGVGTARASWGLGVGGSRESEAVRNPVPVPLSGSRGLKPSATRVQANSTLSLFPKALATRSRVSRVIDVLSDARRAGAGHRSARRRGRIQIDRDAVRPIRREGARPCVPTSGSATLAPATGTFVPPTADLCFGRRRHPATECGQLLRPPAASRHRLRTVAPATGGIPPPAADNCTGHRRNPATGRGQLLRPPAASRHRVRTIASATGGIPPPSAATRFARRRNPATSADICFGYRRLPVTECGDLLRPPAASRRPRGHLSRPPAESRHRLWRFASTDCGIPPPTADVCFDRLRNPATDCGRLLRPPAESRRPRGHLPRPPAAPCHRQGQTKKAPRPGGRGAKRVGIRADQGVVGSVTVPGSVSVPGSTGSCSSRRRRRRRVARKRDARSRRPGDAMLVSSFQEWVVVCRRRRRRLSAARVL